MLTDPRTLIAGALVVGFLATIPPAVAGSGGSGGASEDNGAGGSGGDNSATGSGGAGDSGNNGGGGGGGGAGSPFSGNGGRGGDDDGSGGGNGGAAGASNGASGKSGEGGSGGGGGGGGGAGAAGYSGSEPPNEDATGGNGGAGGDGSSNIFHDGGGGGGGGAGGFGAVVTGSGDLGTIDVNIRGGNGGNGGDGGFGAVGTAPGHAGVAGSGGIGLALARFSQVEVGASSTIAGGNGGTGGYADSYDGVSGSTGGDAVYAGLSLINGGIIRGGSGGLGGGGSDSGSAMMLDDPDDPGPSGGLGGNGGGGVIFPNDQSYLLNIDGGQIYGGTGGNGGNGFSVGSGAGNYGGNGANGGNGGPGIKLGGNEITAGNYGTITGGAGGNGGSGGLNSARTGDGGNGGNGGNGALVSGDSVTLTNDGNISGGNGGAGGAGGNYGVIGKAGAGVIASGASFNLINTGTISNGNGREDSAAIVFTGGTGRLELRQGSVIRGDVDATSSSNDTLALGGAVDWSFGVDQFGKQYKGFESFEKVGSGTWTLTGTMSDSGSWMIEQGVLIVNGSIASSRSLNVNAGGTVGGTGTLPSTTVSGTLSPGDPSTNSVGTINVSGDLAFKRGSIYAVDFTSADIHDKIVVNGKAILAGTLAIRADTSANYQSIQPLTILGASGGLSGTFSEVSTGSAFIDASLSYEDQVQLTLIAQPFDSVALTPNHHAVASMLDAGGVTGSLERAVFGSDTDAAARLVFDELSGEVHASIKTALIEDTRLIRDAVTDRVRAAFGDAGAPVMPALSYGPDGAVSGPVGDSSRFTTWGSAFGSWSSIDGDGNAAGLDHSTGGFLLGGDAPVGEAWRVGLFTGYSRTSFHVDDVASSGNSDNIHLGVYAGAQWRSLGLRLGAAYAWNDIETSRSVGLSGAGSSLNSSYDAGTTQLFGELGYQINTKAAIFEPFAGLAYVNVDSDNLTEDGGMAALTVGGGSIDTTFTTLGLRASTRFLLGQVQVGAHAAAGWRHAFGDITPTTTNVFADGAAFTVAGVPINEDAAVLNAGFDFALSDDASLDLAYSGQIASGAQDHGFKANLSVRF